MSRTNIEIDDAKLAIVMRRYGIHTKTEAVDLALGHLAGQPMTIDEAPSVQASKRPSVQASKRPSVQASKRPSVQASKRPSVQASKRPSVQASKRPSVQASKRPSKSDVR